MKSLLLAGLLALAVAALACGDDDDDGGGGAVVTATAAATGAADGATDGVVNDCSEADAEDLTGQQSVTIEFDDATTVYRPACILVDAGTEVVFSGNFGIHPLQPGAIDGTTKNPAADSPLSAVTDGDPAAFVLAEAGTYGFYCNIHWALGMKGAVIVR
jgi:plastocyanin